MNKKNKTLLARAGMLTKGIIYCLAGILTTIAVMAETGQKTSTKGVLDFVNSQPFGKVLLFIMGVGLLGYVVWQLYRAIEDPENEGDDKEGMAKRIGYAGSAVAYGALSFLAFKMSFDGGSLGGSQKKKIIASLLEDTWGQYVIGIIGLGLLSAGIYNIYNAYKEKFKEKVNLSSLSTGHKKAFERLGKVGLTARGIVYGIIAYFLVRAAIEANPQQAGGTGKAFEFLQNVGGQILLGAIAIRFICYGVFEIYKSRYRVLNL